MSSAVASWHQVGTLRDKVALVRCHDWVLGFEARHVRQVGFPDAVEGMVHEADPGLPAHVGRGRIGPAACSVWDLGRLLGQPVESRATIALERPGGLVVFRCGEILSVDAVAGERRLPVPAGLSSTRPGVFKEVIVLGADEPTAIAYLLRASALLDRGEVLRVHRDWQQVNARR
ncbi:MAG: hypothetical protein ACK53T_14455 [Planctomycetota bacterium]|jgi:hypothetical protein